MSASDSEREDAPVPFNSWLWRDFHLPFLTDEMIAEGRHVIFPRPVYFEGLFRVRDLTLEVPGEPPRVIPATVTIPDPPPTQAPSSFISVQQAAPPGHQI